MLIPAISSGERVRPGSGWNPAAVIDTWFSTLMCSSSFLLIRRVKLSTSAPLVPIRIFTKGALNRPPCFPGMPGVAALSTLHYW